MGHPPQVVGNGYVACINYIVLSVTTHFASPSRTTHTDCIHRGCNRILRAHTCVLHDDNRSSTSPTFCRDAKKIEKMWNANDAKMMQNVEPKCKMMEMCEVLNHLNQDLRSPPSLGRSGFGALAATSPA